MLASLLYLVLRRLLTLVAPNHRSDHVAQIEILVLRDQLGVLRRQVKRPVYRRRDRALLASSGSQLRAGWWIWTSSRRSPRTIDASRKAGERGSRWKLASATRASSFACRAGARMNDDDGPRSSMACFRWSYTRRSTDRAMRFGATDRQGLGRLWPPGPLWANGRAPGRLRRSPASPPGRRSGEAGQSRGPRWSRGRGTPCVTLGRSCARVALTAP